MRETESPEVIYKNLKQKEFKKMVKEHFRINQFLLILSFSLILGSCNSQKDQKNEKTYSNEASSKRKYTEEEITNIYKEYRKNRAQHREDDSIRFIQFQNIKSIHNIRKNVIEAFPLVNELGEISFHPDERFLMTEHEKFKSISWKNKGKDYTLDSIGNFYTIVNNHLFVINSQINKIFVFSPTGEKIKTLAAPNLKNDKMIQGRKYPDDDKYNPGRWYINPAGIPIENSNSEVVGYKTRPGDLAAGFSEKITIKNEEYLMINVLGNHNIEKQFLNLETFEWLDLAIWVGIL